VRLLVYGGNQHAERRRIGAWPDEIVVPVFQDTYGSSMRSPSFGLGVLDDSPFLILRKIENFGERAYPLVILLDPGRDTWERFRWNGAHLLSALFGTIDSPGIKLLTDPESYHTEEHLAQLLTEVDDGIPKNDESSEISNPECLLDLWSGSVFAESPLIVPVDAQLTGFSSRPHLTALLSLISKLPSSLRCGKGWLFGGRDRHAESLGTHLIFDDGKSDPPTDSEKASFIQFQRHGHQLRTTLESLSESTDDEESQLKKYLSQPVFEWIDSGDTALIASLQDIFLIRELKEHGDSEAENLDELFARVNERLRTPGKLNKEIAAAAHRLIAHKKRERTPAETVFILTQAKSKLTDKDLSDLDKDAARSFFIEHKIFPADAVGRMPPSIRLSVCQELLKVEEQVSTIPSIFSKEAALLPGYEEQELDLLLHEAVERSASLNHGLRFWKKLFDHEDMGADVQEVLRARVLDEANPEEPNSIADYLILANDAGGDQLISIKPALTKKEALDKFLKFVVEQSRSSDEPELKQSAKLWLIQLGKSELRLKVSLKQKDVFAPLLNHKHWLNYLAMRRAFKGESRSSTAIPDPDKQERKFLAAELTAATADPTSHEPGFIPDLDRLSKLLEPDYLSSMVEALLPLEPDLTSEGGLHWVEGWLHLAQKKPALDAEQLSQCLVKHRSQLVRLILETSTSLEKSELLKELQHDDLTCLFKQLLVGGGDDQFLRQRLAAVLETPGPKDRNKAIQEVFDDILYVELQEKTLTRRFVGQQKDLTRIQNRLTKEQKIEFQNLFEEKNRQESKRVTNEVLEIFSSPDRESALGRLGKVKFNASKVGKDIFKEALVGAVDELASSAELQHSFLSGEASSFECCNFIRTELGQHKKQIAIITGLYGQRKNREHIASINRYVMDGGQERDAEYRRSLDKFLKDEDKVDALTINGLNAAVKRALSNQASVQTLIRRFIPMARTVVSGEESHKIQRAIELDHLFKYLDPPIRRAFLRKLWIHYGIDKSTNPLIAPTRDVYHKVRDLTPETQKDLKPRSQKKKKKKEESKLYLNIFDETCIDFLANNKEFRKRFAQLELGSDKAGSIEDDLLEYITDPQEDEPIEDTGSLKSKKGLVSNAFAYVKGVFNGSEVKKTERSQEGDDQ
jgi:hypothetical protein